MNTKQLLVSLLLSQLLIAGVSHAEQISGRLFTTPNERANLDYLRQTSKVPSPELYEDEENITVAPILPGSVSMQGYVKRGDGKKGTVWVNNEPVQENSDTSEVHVGKLPRTGGQVQINIPASGRNVNLKAGQVYVPETDKIIEEGVRAKLQESGSTGEPLPIEGNATKSGQ